MHMYRIYVCMCKGIMCICVHVCVYHTLSIRENTIVFFGVQLKSRLDLNCDQKKMGMCLIDNQIH